MKQQEQVPVGTFWDDLNRDLDDPEVRRDFEANAVRIQMIDRIMNSIEQQREAVGLSRADLAKAIGGKPRSVKGFFLRRRKAYDVKNLLDIATVLGMDVEVKVSTENRPLSTAGYASRCSAVRAANHG